MKNKKIVIALGGNAILSENPTAQAQQEALRQTAQHLVKLIQNDNQLIITHGNGPQVGNLLLQNIAADSKTNPAFPLDSLVAMTEGSIGYWLQNALQNELTKHSIDKTVVSLVSQVIVDEKDPAFDNLSKPIGPFLTEEEAKEQMAQTDATYKEDAGRGWRKVVASPRPVAIKESKAIQALVEVGYIVVAVGGGGVPVIQREGQLHGVEAVIDKDFASQKLANHLEADLLIILTGVDAVYLNYKKETEKKLNKVTTDQLEIYIEEGQFAPGSMLPKVQAAIQFVEATRKGQAVITSLENLAAFLEDGSGTIISNQ